MNQRAQYLIQILDKIGAPLLGAAARGNDDTDTAQVVASLLGKVVEASISMNQALDLDAADAQDDSLRVALAALAGDIVADQYKQKGKLPEAADLTRIQSAMSAVLTFGDNFTLSPDHVERLSKMKADGGIVDAHQINIQYVNALIPVINAVGAFPFGQPEQKLIMDVSDRLVKRTAEMRETLLPGLSGDDEKLAELAILRATASVYASCHEAETQRLTGSDSDAPDSLSIDPVWKAFESRTAMLEAVVKNIMPAGAATKASIAPAVAAAPVLAAAESSATPPPPPAAESGAPEDAPQKPAIFGGGESETPTPPVAAEPPPQPPPQEAPPAAPAPTEEAASSGGAGPMGFFAKPKEGDDATPVADASVSPPLAQPETPSTPPVEPPPAAAPPVAPPAQEEATPPPTPDNPPAQENTDSEGEGDKGGNPMSFFGKKD